MRPSRITLLGGALAITAAACTSALHVDTLAAPNAGLANFSTFRVLRVPIPRDGRVRTDKYDPMLNNSVANLALRDTITKAFAGRGYIVNELAPDFDVAVYAAAMEKLDVTRWDYGYPFWPQARFNWKPGSTIVEQVEYPEGTVIVDVVRARDHELLWRGSATARMWNDATDVKELQELAATIVKKFPAAIPRRVAIAR